MVSRAVRVSRLRIPLQRLRRRVRYNHYLAVDMMASSEEEHRAWVGWVESRLRKVWNYLYQWRSLLLSSPFFDLSLLVVTQIRGHIAGSSLPLPSLRFVPCIFITRIFELFLPSSTRVELLCLTHARRSQQ